MALLALSSPVALLADIHGNLAALDAVIADLGRRGVSEIYVAGDLLFGGADPHGTWRRLVEVKAKCVRGVSDTALATLDAAQMKPSNDAEAARLAMFLDARAAVGEVVLKYLSRLPDRMRVPLADGGELLLVHGAPIDPMLELTHDLGDDEVLALVADDPADIIACGGAHVPFLRDFGELRVVGLGSVGESPEGRVAHYTVMSPRPEGTMLEQTWVEY